MRCALLIAMLAAAAMPGVTTGGSHPLKGGRTAVRLRAVVEERLSLTSGTPLVRLSLYPHQLVRAERPISFTTSWNLDRTRTAVVVSAFFEGESDALRTVENGSGEDTIARSPVWGRASSGIFMPFSENIGVSERGIEVFREPLKAGVNDMASRTDEFELKIDMSGKRLRGAGEYQGVLTLIVEAY